MYQAMDFENVWKIRFSTGSQTFRPQVQGGSTLPGPNFLIDFCFWYVLAPFKLRSGTGAVILENNLPP